jgi:malonate-semialdehyde dehydrogenase (acetylating)/methylmalonate-semialdehyde dehydrogenase
MVPLWMHPMAIATGNTFVLKPSERDPSVSNLVAELYAEAGLPDGVFNVVHGDKEAVDALLDHPDVAAVSFVGSTPIARYVHGRRPPRASACRPSAARRTTPWSCPDADLDFTAGQLTSAGFGSAGQRCMAISVVVAVGDAAEPLVERLRARALDVTVGPGPEPRAARWARSSRPRRASASWATSARASRPAPGPWSTAASLEVEGDGFFVGPDALDGVTPDMSSTATRSSGPSCPSCRSEPAGGDRAHQRQRLRQRDRDLHGLGAGRADLPAPRRGRG